LAIRLCDFGKVSANRAIKRQIIESTAEETAAAKLRRGETMHLNAIDRFTRWQCCLRIIVGLPRRDDMDFIRGAGQVKRQVGENLTRGGVIGKEIPVDEDQPLHIA
jgi:hypothetical protein